MIRSVHSAGITGLGISLPPRVLSNQDIEKIVSTSDEWIRTRTGISERRILEEGQFTSDLATEAAERALRSAGVEPAQVDLVIVATATSDAVFPATASIVQHRLGALNAGAFDISAACSGLMYGLATGAQFVQSGTFETVLVIGAEAMSRILDWSDRSTCILFGDGASAAVIQRAPAGHGFLSFSLGSDGSGANLLFLEPCDCAGLATDDHAVVNRSAIRMNGSEVFRFAVKIMVDAAHTALKKAGLGMEDVDLFVPHQANIRILDAATRRMGIDSQRTFSNVDRYGNTSAASIGIALAEAAAGGHLKQGDLALLVGFGAGLSWGSAVLRWHMIGEPILSDAPPPRNQ